MVWQATHANSHKNFKQTVFLRKGKLSTVTRKILCSKKTPPCRFKRILRASEKLEVFLSSGKSIFTFHKRQKKKEYYQPLFLGIKIFKEELHRKINQRVLDMFRAGWIAEVESLLKKYPASIPAFNSIGYKQVVDFLQSKSTKKNEMIEKYNKKVVLRQKTKNMV